MATTIRGGERRPHQNYNNLQNDVLAAAITPPPSPLIAAVTPPPSPLIAGDIPLMSTAVSGSSINEYLSANRQIPALERLAERRPPSASSSSATTTFRLHPRMPEQIDLRLLASGVGNSIERLMRSAKEFGMFRMTGHGISGEEMAEARAVAAEFFRRLDERKNKFKKRSFVERIGNREEFVWFVCDKAMTLWAREVLGPYGYRDFSYKMDSLVSRLDKISEDVAEIFVRNSNNKFVKNIQESESIISIYRINDMNPSLLVSNEDCHECNEHALGLHLAMEHGEFFANTTKGPLSFDVDPETIVVTIGDQLVEWSAREFKCATGEVIFDSNLHGSEAFSYSLELKCSPLNLNFGYTKKNTKKISIVDQLLILLILSFLYKLVFPSHQ